MPSIVDYPTVVKNAMDNFFSIFQGTPQREHFAKYLTGLMVADRKTVNSISNEFVDAKDQSCLNRFMTEAKWDEKKLNELRLEWLQEDESTRYTKSGVIAVDNVLIDHTGKTIEDVGYFWDHADKRNVIAHDYLIANYVCKSRKHYPLEFRRFKKKIQCEEEDVEFKNHTTLFCELVDWVETKKIPGTFAFDSYFSNSIIQNHINSYCDKRGNSRAYVGDLKFNRKVNVNGGPTSITEVASNVASEERIPVKTNYGNQWCWSKTFSIPEVDHRVKIVIIWDRKNGTTPAKILISNKTEWIAEKIIEVYKDRWTGTETFHRDGKQELGMGDCQLREGRAQTRHMYLVMLAYSLLMKELRLKGKSSWCVEKLMTIGEACRAILKENLRSTIEWAVKRGRELTDQEQLFRELKLC